MNNKWRQYHWKNDLSKWLHNEGSGETVQMPRFTQASSVRQCDMYPFYLKEPSVSGRLGCAMLAWMLSAHTSKSDKLPFPVFQPTKSVLLSNDLRKSSTELSFIHVCDILNKLSQIVM